MSRLKSIVLLGLILVLLLNMQIPIAAQEGGGGYTLQGADGTLYVVAPQGADLPPYQLEAIPQSRNLAPSLDDVTFTNSVLASDSGSVSGRVFDRQGNPKANILVGFASNVGYTPVCTDASGNYTLFNIPFNTPIRVHTETNSSFCGGGDNGIVNFYNDTPNYWQATTITLTDAAPSMSNVNLYWEQGGSISGTIVDAGTNQPIDTRVGIYIDNFIGTSGAFTYCNDSWGDPNYGDYVYKGVPFNIPFYVSIYVNGCGNFGSNYANAVSPTAHTVTPQNPQVTGVNFALGTLGTINGTIRRSDTNTPQGNVRVIGSSEYVIGLGSWYQETCSDINGQYSFSNVQPNLPIRVYTLDTTMVNACGDPSPYGQTYGGDTPFYYQADRYTLTSGQNLVVDINQIRMGIVNASISINGADGLNNQLENTPVSDIVVWIRYYDPTYPNITGQAFYCSSDGNFTGYAPFGYDFRIFIEATYQRCNQERTPYVTQFYGGDYTEASGTLLEVNTGTPSQSVNFVAEMGAKVTGTVSNQSSNPILYSSVFSQIDGEDYAFAYTGNSNVYEILGIPLNTDVTLYANAYNYANEWWQNAPTLLNATVVQATVAGSTVSNINFTLAPYTTITGTVRDSNNQPINGAAVSVEGFPFAVCTDANGDYVMGLVAAESNYVVYAGGNDSGCLENGTFSKVYYNGVDDFGNATSVAGGSSNIDFVLGGTIPNTVDVNDDGLVSAVDAIFVVNRLGDSPTGGDYPADVDNDGDIDNADIQAVLDALGTTP